jgi:hypothetical protein
VHGSTTTQYYPELRYTANRSRCVSCGSGRNYLNGAGVKRPLAQFCVNIPLHSAEVYSRPEIE